MKKYISILSMSALLACYGHASDYKPSNSKYALAMIGEYHSVEVKLRNNEQVNVMSIDKLGVTTLKRDTLMLEFYEGELGGRVKVNLKSGIEDNVYILRMPVKKTGELQSIQFPDLKSCVLEGCKVKFGGTDYEVVTKNITPNEHEVGSFKDEFEIEIKSEKGKTTLREVGGIIWAGDLNEDGELDILYEDDFHYNTYVSLKLMLSAKTNKGPILKKVAEFAGGGC